MKQLLRMPVFTPLLIWTLIGLTFWLGWCQSEGWAMLAPAVTSEMGTDAARTADLQTVQRVLESKVIQQRLLDLGLTAEETQTRLARLSNEELHQLALQIDALAPGGDAVLGVVIALLVIVILVVVLIWLLNHKVSIEKDPNAAK
jgi:hypothetical protein